MIHLADWLSLCIQWLLESQFVNSKHSLRKTKQASGNKQSEDYKLQAHEYKHSK